jgi:hypothetical protein
LEPMHQGQENPVKSIYLHFDLLLSDRRPPVPQNPQGIDDTVLLLEPRTDPTAFAAAGRFAQQEISGDRRRSNPAIVLSARVATLTA